MTNGRTRAGDRGGRSIAVGCLAGFAALTAGPAAADPLFASGPLGGAPTLWTTALALAAAALLGTAVYLTVRWIARRRAAEGLPRAPVRSVTHGPLSAVGALLALGALLLVITGFVYQASVQSMLGDTRRTLATLADAQVRNLAEDRQRLETGALTLSSSRLIVEDIAAWRGPPAQDDRREPDRREPDRREPDRRERLRLLLAEGARTFGFASADLWSGDGRFLIGTGTAPRRADLGELVRRVASSGQITQVPASRDAGSLGGFGFLVRIPVRIGGADDCCVLFLESAAQTDTHPLLDAVFRTAHTAEALLVGPGERGGANILLTVNRTGRDYAVRAFASDPYDFAASPDRPDAPGLGQDHLGHRVLAVRAPIPGSYNALTIKVDEDEILSGARTSAFLSAALACVLLLLALAIGRGLLQKTRLREAARELAASRALNAAEARFQAAFEQSGSGILHLALDGSILRANGTSCRMLGRRREELVGIPFWSLRAGATDGAEVLAPLVEGRAADMETEERYLRRDGSAAWLAANFTLVRDADQAADHILVVAQDVTARRATEAALRESEERFDLAVKGSDQGVWDLDVRTGALYLSPRAREMLGIGPAEPVDLKRAWREMLHRDDWRKAARAWKTFLRAGARSFELEVRMRGRDGTFHDFRWQGLAARGPDGTGSRVVGMIADTTAARQTERHLRLAAAVFASSHDGLVVTDLNAVVSAINPAFSRITGYAEGEIVGQSMRALHSGRHDRGFYRSMWSELTSTGSWQGEIWNRRKNGEIFLQQLNIGTVYDGKGAPQNYVGAFQDITQIKHSEFQLDRIAHYDSLTDLPNRTLLASLLDLAVGRPGKSCAVLFVDLDRFKTVNDSLGHLAGDAVLKMAAERMQAALDRNATLGRYGADEFVIILEEIGGPEDAAGTATRLIRELSRPFKLTEGEAYLGASAGISLFPEDADSPAKLLQHADSALAEAKSHGRGSYAFYTQALTRSARLRLEMEADMRRGLAREEFHLNFQPVVDLATGRVMGSEALVRWHSPVHGLVTPNRFIPLAEETGLIEPLGDWVLEEACRQMADWLSRGVELDFIAVNLSPRQFQRGALCEHVQDVLRRTGLPADRLEIEITENVLFEARAAAERKLRQLKESGVRIALDDFGTGYSSLAYLKRFPISKLKIDRSFVRDLPRAADAEIATAIISIARALGLTVVAEGIEDLEQCAFLKARGCDLGQGHLFSRPVAEERFLRLAALESLAPEPMAPGSAALH